jgi:phosphoribosylanthranilate isomerase
MKVRTKICGITRVEDGVAAAEAGADAIGLVFYPPSPRAIDFQVAREVVHAVGPFVTTVALFVNPEPVLVRQVLDQVEPVLLQFHGDESDAFCQQFERPYLKAIRVREDTDIAAETALYPGAAGFIFDAWSKTLYGGTGKVFNWHKLESFGGAHSILAGGLTPDNVGDAIDVVQPYGVDVSGGVEKSPGIKDHNMVRQFVEVVTSKR